MTELFKFLLPSWYRGTCLKPAHAVLGGFHTVTDLWYLQKKFSGAKGKTSPQAVISVHVLSAMVGEFLKNKKFPNNVFTERDKTGCRKNYLKIIKEEGSGSHWD